MAEYFEVEIESMRLDGRGVGQRDGKTAHVGGALPNERVRYARLKSKPHREVGEVEALLRESPQRVVPQCPHFGFFKGACGACSLQHLDMAAQLAAKQRLIDKLLWEVAAVRAQTVLPPIDGPAWHYRHRARLSVRYVQRRDEILVGFHERARSFVADMQSCAILAKRVSDLLMPLRVLIAGLTICRRLPQIEVAVGDETVVLLMRVLDPPSIEDREALLQFGRAYDVSIWLQPGGSDTIAPLDGNADVLSMTLPEFGITLPFAPTEFTQVNHQLNAILVGRTVDLLAPQADEVVVDFFCGLGNFSLPLATRARQVVGLEGSPALVARAGQAAQQNGLAQRAVFAVRDLFKWEVRDWEALIDQYGSPSGTISDTTTGTTNGRSNRIDRVLIDPPRAGALAVVEAFAATHLPPKRLVYISCNPETLARDVAVLVQQGGWHLHAAGVVNMFPHTAHVETIAVLEPSA